MISFGVEPFEPGNMMYVGIAQEMEDERVDKACSYIRYQYGNSLYKREMEMVFEMFDIAYPLLANYNKLKFDEFDICD